MDSKTNSKLQKDKDFLTDTIFKVAKVKTDLANFLDDLLTEEEFSDLSQRLKVAKSLIKDKTYEETSEKVDVSTSTITKIGQIIKYGKGAFEKLWK
jgi:TrpR-related protein YerC/YecD